MLAQAETNLVMWVIGLLAVYAGVIVYLYKQLSTSNKEKYDTLIAANKEKFDLLVIANKEKYDLMLAAKDREIGELEESKKSLKQITSEAVSGYLQTANFYRERDGKPPIVPLAPVESEKHSPPTAKQLETAEIATFRAKMAQINLATGIVPTKEEEASVPDSVEKVTLATKADINRLEENIADVPEKVAERLEEKEPDEELVPDQRTAQTKPKRTL